MDLPPDAIERWLRNSLGLQIATNTIARSAERILRELFDEIAAELARIDPTEPGAEVYRRMRVQKLLERIERMVREAFREWQKEVRQELAYVGRQQGEEAARILVAAIGDARVAALVGGTPVTVNQMKAILDHNPFRGETLSGWAKVQEQATVRRIRQAIQLGMAQNETIEDMIERIRGRNGVGGILQTTRREAEAIVRTAVTEIAARAHLMTYEANADVTTSYRYTATLDSRTTLICAELDGRIFRYDDPNKKLPPQHWNCRSTIVPIVDWDKLGIDPPPPSTRASDGGPVPARLDYEGWLRRQPAAKQDEILGPGRGRLFREGMTLAEMVRSDGAVIPLSELRGKK